MERRSHRPGDILLDRYLRGADEATREAAREDWKAFVRALLRVATRLALAEEERSRDSPNPDRRLRIRSLPPKV
jgi:hypothetical protein